MAIVGLTHPTISDVAKRTDPDGKIAKLVELLKQTNEILEDATFVEGNLPTGHRTTMRTGLPDVTWRLLNRGVQPGKSATAQVDDACGMLEAYGEVDASLAALNGNTAEWRMSEDSAFIEAMNQEMARTLFYGNVKEEPQKFMGLAPRYNGLSGFAAAENILDYGGSGSQNTSVWLVGWGDATLHCIFPKGSQAGLRADDKGEQTLFDEDGGRYQGYRTHYKWDVGLSQRDWRYCGRIANINTAAFGDIISGGATQENSRLIRFMIALMNKIPNTGKARLAWYLNRSVKTVLDIMAMEKANVNLTIDMFEGKPITRFLGVPLRQVDVLLNTEAALA